MKLSEAIRLGAMLKPQAFGQYGSVASCALRAATDALGIPPNKADSPDYDALKARYRYLDVLQPCPVPTCWLSGETDRALAVIYHLNDHHQWTREQIADWIATIEPQDAEPQTGEQSQSVAKQSERLLGTGI